ncbi:30S ribosomal protein S8 [Candidatus Gracilibacteria bacterium]|nr:30S ribosomal protein S8 [Candidatus Gracilibacteria bacterium]
MSDFVARINNAVMVGNENVVVLKNNLVIEVSKKLVTLGYLEGFEEQERTLTLQIKLNGISSIKRYSKPGHRQYFSYKEFPKIINGMGYNILTTSKGVKTNIEAKEKKLGGELLFTIF